MLPIIKFRYVNLSHTGRQVDWIDSLPVKLITHKY